MGPSSGSEPRLVVGAKSSSAPGDFSVSLLLFFFLIFSSPSAEFLRPLEVLPPSGDAPLDFFFLMFSVSSFMALECFFSNLAT